MTDRDICKKIVKNGNCLVFRCKNCPLLGEKKYKHNGAYDCVEPAKKWLKDNPETPLDNIPKWDDLPWVMGKLNGSLDKWIQCKVLLNTGNNFLCSTNPDAVCYCYFCSDIKPYIKTIDMKIPLDKVAAVNELIK